MLLGAATVAAGCGGAGEAPAAAPEPPAGASAVFVERAASTGLDFVHFNGMSGRFYVPEMMGPGAALFDLDNDGDLDVYLVQGSMLGEDRTVEESPSPPRHPLPLTDRVYRNDLVVGKDGSRTLRFTDVTEELGLKPASGYGQGAAAGDFDGDGFTDLYVTRFGPNQLLRNAGGRALVDVTASSGTDDRRWSIAAAFVDIDRDGRLDLYVGNFLDFRLRDHLPCESAAGWPDYCGPLSYHSLPDRLFRNQGDGTFSDVTGRSGIAAVEGNTLGVIAGDFDGNGWPDLYVANDSQPNFLWLGQGNGTFREAAVAGGSAVNDSGKAEASMGVAAGDFDDDGDEDLFMSHLSLEKNTLYKNLGSGMFEDDSVGTGLAAPSVPFTGFGTAFLDYDNDGRLDLLVVNGAINRREELLRRGDVLALAQRNQLFHNLGGGRFEEVLDPAVTTPEEVSRGLAVGDLDNDGGIDALVANNAGSARLLLNRARRGHWLGLHLVLGEPPTDAIGAWAAVYPQGGGPLGRRVRTCGSYASASDPRLLVGVGDADRVDRAVVQWPDGEVEEFGPFTVDTYHVVRQGRGRPEQASPSRSVPTGG